MYDVLEFLEDAWPLLLIFGLIVCGIAYVAKMDHELTTAKQACISAGLMPVEAADKIYCTDPHSLQPVRV